MKKLKLGIKRALQWWNDLPIQDLKECRDGWANLTMRYFPDRTSCMGLSESEILHIWQQEQQRKINEITAKVTQIAGISPTTPNRKQNVIDARFMYFYACQKAGIGNNEACRHIGVNHTAGSYYSRLIIEAQRKTVVPEYHAKLISVYELYNK